MAFTAGADLGGIRADLSSVPLGGVDSAGVAWALQGMEGWDSAEVRAEFAEREADHGAWASPVYLGSRPITLSGTVTAPDRMALEDALDRLRAAVALTDTLLVVYELTTPKRAMVRRSGKPLFAYVTDRIATYSVMVTAADPRRYSTSLESETTNLPSSSGGLTPPLTPPLTSTAVTVSGEITAENEGTLETRAVFTIAGPADSPQILTSMPDGSVIFLNYTDILYSGDVLVIDTDAKTCILNGAVSRRRFLVTPTGWPTIPAESTVAVQFRAKYYNSSATLTAQWRSAWM